MNSKIVSRSIAYNLHYRNCWKPRKFTRASAENYFACFLDVEKGGQINGNEVQFAFKMIGVPDIRNKVILDYCCGTGFAAIYFAMLGAKVFAFDRSLAAIEIAKKSATLSGVDSLIQFMVADSNELPFYPETFDAVFCQSALHIVVEYKKFLPELSRVTKTGGNAIFCDEALGNNVFFEIFRYFRRKKYRECGGRPLKYGDLMLSNQLFSSTEVYHFNLLMQTKIFLSNYLSLPWVRCTLKVFRRIDQCILGMIPGLRQYCGKIVVGYVK